jgi:hypothetical protein
MAVQGFLNVKSLSELPDAVWFIPPILIVAAIVMVPMYRRRALIHCFRNIAAQTGLELHTRLTAPPELAGRYLGRAVAMTKTSPRRYSFNRWWTLVTVNLQQSNKALHFKLRRQDPIDRMFRIFGFGRLRIGDGVFDHHFLIWSHDPDGTKRLLSTNSLRQELIHADVYIAQTLNGKLYVYYSRAICEPGDAGVALNAAANLADGIDRLANPE